MTRPRKMTPEPKVKSASEFPLAGEAHSAPGMTHESRPLVEL
jgi:hypothetical protein